MDASAYALSSEWITQYTQSINEAMHLTTFNYIIVTTYTPTTSFWLQLYIWSQVVSPPRCSPLRRMRQAVDGGALEVEVHRQRRGNVDGQNVMLQFGISGAEKHWDAEAIGEEWAGPQNDSLSGSCPVKDHQFQGQFNVFRAYGRTRNIVHFVGGLRFGHIAFQHPKVRPRMHSMFNSFF